MGQLNIFKDLRRKTAVLVLVLALAGVCSGCTRSEAHDSAEEIGYVYEAVREYRSTNPNANYAGFVAWMEERGRE